MKKSIAFLIGLSALFGTFAVADESKVARAQFTTGVAEREPVDRIEQLDATHDQVWFFTEFTDAAGQRLTHRWEYEGEVMAEVPFDVGGPRWRVWSSKQLMPDWQGTWTVSVLDSEGQELASESLVYTGDEQAAMDDAASGESVEESPAEETVEAGEADVSMQEN